MHTCGKLSRSLMLVSNVVLFVGSVGLLALSLWGLIDQHYLLVLLGDDAPFWLSVSLAVIGCVTFFLAIIGCIGVLRKRKELLIVYLIMGILLFIVTISGGIMCVLFRAQAPTTLQTDLKRRMGNYTLGSGNQITRAFDDMQIEFECCGILNHDDWQTFNTFDRVSEQMPQSCCSKGRDCKTSSNYFNDVPCYDKLILQVQHYSLVIGGASTALGILMLSVVLCTIVVYIAIERRYMEVDP